MLVQELGVDHLLFNGEQGMFLLYPYMVFILAIEPSEDGQIIVGGRSEHVEVAAREQGLDIEGVAFTDLRAIYVDSETEELFLGLVRPGELLITRAYEMVKAAWPSFKSNEALRVVRVSKMAGMQVVPSVRMPEAVAEQLVSLRAEVSNSRRLNPADAELAAEGKGLYDLADWIRHHPGSFLLTQTM